MDKKCLLVIVSLNQLDYTRGCVDSVVKNTTFPYKILIVDNGSDKESLSYLHKLKAEGTASVIFNSQNTGWVNAVNQGIFYSDFPYVCIMNNDIVVYPGWLSEMVSIAQSCDSIGIVNPLWEVPKRFRGSLNEYINNVIKTQASQYIETDWVRGFCFLIKRAVIDAVGGLDKDFSPGYCDDWDYSVRAFQAGFKCVRAKGAFVYHYRNVTAAASESKEALNHRIQVKEEIFFRKWGKPLKIFAIVDKKLKLDTEALKAFFLRILRDQNRLTIIHNRPGFTLEHTNCFLRYSPVFMNIALLFNLFDNLRHSLQKRYQLIVASEAMNTFLKKCFFIRRNYTCCVVDNTEDFTSLFDKIAAIKKHT